MVAAAGGVGCGWLCSIPSSPHTHSGELKVVEAVVCEDEPASLPCLHAAP